MGLFGWVQQRIADFRRSRRIGRLLARAEDENPAIRRQALEGMAELQDPRVLPTLMRFLGDRDMSLHEAARGGLLRAGDPGIEALVGAFREADSSFRSVLAETLGGTADPRAVKVLIGRLGDEAPAVSWSAGRSLMRIGRPAVEGLIQALGSGDLSLRRRAAEILGEVRDPRAVGPLIMLLQEGDRGLGLSAKWGLVKIGRPSVAGLLSALENEAPVVRMRAAEALEEIGALDSIDPLMGLAADPDAGVRATAQGILTRMAGRFFQEWTDSMAERDFSPGEMVLSLAGQIPGLSGEEAQGGPFDRMSSGSSSRPDCRRFLLREPRFHRLLCTALDDPAPAARAAAVAVLDWIGDPRTGEDLVLALKDEDPQVRKGAGKALIHLGQSIVPRLIESLADEDAEMRKTAAGVLRDLRDPRAVRPLIEAMGDDHPEVQRAAKWALIELGPRAAEGVIGALGEGAPSSRRNAAEVLGEIREPGAIEPLIAALGDESPDVRLAAKIALEKFGELSAEALLKAMGASDSSVRSSAGAVLENIGRTAMHSLVGALESGDVDERSSAAHVLGEIGDP
ncbi:MAG: HEAT repeat domain-containing protein, partial [Deltaproteobacteria bacterium]|nr:HEAT repeat domain-containing protein [Deltaproteobacteria bacterium]